MRPKKETVQIAKPEALLQNIVQSIQDKKGEEIISLDLRAIRESVTDHFIICHASTNTQVKAITDHIIRTAHENLAEKPWQIEGINNLEWVLIDFVDIVVHVFLKEKRLNYNLESLWSDASVTRFAES